MTQSSGPNRLAGPDIRDALAATADFPGVTGKVTFNENRDAVKPIVMIEIKQGGIYAVRERVEVEGAAAPGMATSPSPAATSPPAGAASPAASPASAATASPSKAASPAKPAAQRHTVGNLSRESTFD